MGTLYARSGTWKLPTDIYVKISGTWTASKKVWRKISGTWVLVFEKQTVPSNLIVLYDDVSHIPAEASIVSELVGRFPLGASSYGGTGGAATHAGSAHGASSASNTSMITDGGGCTTDFQEPPPHPVDVTKYYQHYHTFGHTHADSPSNIPPFIDVIPTLGGKIEIGSVWLTTQSSMPAIFTSYTAALNRYLRMNNVYLTGGDASHNHTYSGSTSSAVKSTSGTVWKSSATTATTTHAHSMNHTHTAITNNPSYLTANIYKAVQALEFGDIPSGTLAFFTDASLPDGWSRYTIADGRLIKCGNASIGSTGGSDTHSHPSSSFSTGGPTSTGSTTGNLGGLGTTTHTHTYNHGHLTEASWMPPYTGIVIGVKS